MDSVINFMSVKSQESIAKQVANFDNCTAPELVSERLNSFDDNCFLRLEGSYSIWQEVLAVK